MTRPAPDHFRDGAGRLRVPFHIIGNGMIGSITYLEVLRNRTADVTRA